MELRVSTTVGAPPAAVYQLFIDIERWPELSESTRSVRRLDSGPLRVGPGLKITITLRTHGPLAGLVDLLVSRVARRHVAMELEGFRAAADAAAPPTPPTG